MRALLLLFLALAVPANAGDWVTFNCREAHFSVQVPNNPTASEKIYPSFIGKVKSHIFVANNETCFFTLSYTDVPSLAVGFARGKTFARARDALLVNCNGQQISFSDLKRHKERAKELIYQVAPQGKDPLMNGRTWFILIGRQLIVADALTRVGPAQDRQSERFFASLKTQLDI